MKRIWQSLAAGRSRVARALASVGLTPDQITTTGFVFGLISGYLFYRGQFRPAAAALTLSALCDFFDGEVSRVSGRGSRFGAFLDSTLDRLTDAAVLGGIMLYYSALSADKYVMLSFAALVGSILTSYTRARAESLVDRCDVGLMERPERIVVLVVAAFAGRVPAALWILAVAANITVVQRIIHVRLALRAYPNRHRGGDAARYEQRKERRGRRIRDT